MATRLADGSRADAVAVALVCSADELLAVTARLRAVEPGARVAAFTTSDPGADTLRLATEQGAAILLLSLHVRRRPRGRLIACTASSRAEQGGGPR